MPVWLNIFFALMLISIIVMEIAENGHPIHTIAWILVLTFLPGVGLILYFFFGRARKNRRMVSSEDMLRLQERSQAVCRAHMVANPPESRKNLSTLLRAAGNALLVGGNDVRVYTDFSEMYNDLLADL